MPVVQTLCHSHNPCSRLIHSQNHRPPSSCIHPGAKRKADPPVKLAVTMRTSQLAGMRLTKPVMKNGRDKPRDHAVTKHAASSALRKRKAGALKNGMEA